MYELETRIKYFWEIWVSISKVICHVPCSKIVRLKQTEIMNAFIDRSYEQNTRTNKKMIRSPKQWYICTFYLVHCIQWTIQREISWIKKCELPQFKSSIRIQFLISFDSSQWPTDMLPTLEFLSLCAHTHDVKKMVKWRDMRQYCTMTNVATQ